MRGPGRPVGTDPARLATRVVTLPTAADTHDFGRRLGTLLRRGDVVVLTGPLGAGKTALTQGIGAGLGVSGQVVSPTFVIARVHDGPVPLVHVDAYRLGSVAEVDDLDLDVDVAHAATVIEWGEGVAEQLSDERLSIELQRAPASEQRTAILLPVGGDWAERVARLTEAQA